MNYAEQAKAAIKNKVAAQLEAEWMEWTKKGQTLVGKLLDCQEVEGRSFKGNIHKYTLMTDDGPVSTNLGNATHKQQGVLMTIGEVYHITYKGDEDTGKGSPRHVFEILHIPSDVDVPF